MILGLTGLGHAAPPQTTIRTFVELVTVDLVVRDRSGALVGGLTLDDFEVREDGVVQGVTLFDALGTNASHAAPGGAGTAVATATPSTAPPAADVTGAMILLFDLAALRHEEVDRAVEAASRYLEDATAPHVRFAVAAITSDLEWLTDLTTDRDALLSALDRVAGLVGFADDPPAARTLAMDEAAALPIDDGGSDSGDVALLPAGRDDLAIFTSDRRLRAIATLARGLERVGRKKAVLYFSGGLARAGQDNEVELRGAIDAAVRANMAIYPVDAAGLQTVLPGGTVTRSSAGGIDLFSGADVRTQFDQLARSEDTLVSLAADTGGRPFLDLNDFREAFTRAAEDLGTYYLLGYTSTNTTRDGRFRRIQVRVRRPGLTVETRAGYYADLDFTHASRADREARLQAELAAPLSTTDLPIVVAAAWFRLGADEYEVPLAIAVPGWSIAAPATIASVPLDIIGEIRDEQQQAAGRIRQTAAIRLDGRAPLADTLLVYRARLRLPPGRFVLKVVVRENVAGRLGSYELPLAVPDLSSRPLGVSAVVVREGAAVASGSRWGPHPTRVVGRDRPLRFYVDVYDPAGADSGRIQIRAGLTCTRDRQPVFETPVAEVGSFDRTRRAAPIVLEVPAGAFSSGVHTCQINVIDDGARRFTFPRITFAVR